MQQQRQQPRARLTRHWILVSSGMPACAQATNGPTDLLARRCRPQAEAQQLVATVASAAEGYPFVPPEYLPSVLVPTVGLIVPAIAMAWVRTLAGTSGGAEVEAQAHCSHSTHTVARCPVCMEAMHGSCVEWRDRLPAPLPCADGT
jgi:hypothetical protein